MAWHIPTENSIAALGVAKFEDSISRTIVGALQDADDALHSDFISHLRLEVPHPRGGRRVAGTQIVMPGGRADIVLAWRVGDQRAQLVVIEHKLHAGEHATQTELYARVESQTHLQASAAAALCLESGSVEWLTTKFVYLTLFDDQPTNENFAACTRRHGDLLPWFERVSAAGLCSSALVRDWAALIRHFESRSTEAHTMSFARAMGDDGNDPLDARYAVFWRFTKAVSEACKLGWWGCYRDSPQGRSWFGSHFALEGWYPRQQLEERGDWEARFAPASDYWVHMQIHWDEMNFDAAAPSLHLTLNFETLPYTTQATFARIVPDERIADAYRAKRKQFCNDPSMRDEMKRLGWSFAGHWVKVASRDLEFGADAMWNDVVTATAAAFKDAIEHVDEAVRRLRLDGR